MEKNNLYLASLLGLALMTLSGCKKNVHQDPDKLPYEMYKEKIEDDLKNSHKLEARLRLEKMLRFYPGKPGNELCELALADLYFEEGKKNYDNEFLQMASNLYKKFYELNPSHQRSEYATYQRICSEFEQTHRIDQDCSGYEKTLKLCKEFLAKQEFSGKQFETDVKNIKYTCERLLIDKEVYVFNCCMRNDQLNSAKNRLEYLQETYLPTHPDIEPRIKYLTTKLAIANKDKATIAKAITDLDTKFADSEFTKMAHNIISKRFNEPAFL